MQDKATMILRKKQQSVSFKRQSNPVVSLFLRRKGEALHSRKNVSPSVSATSHSFPSFSQNNKKKKDLIFENVEYYLRAYLPMCSNHLNLLASF